MVVRRLHILKIYFKYISLLNAVVNNDSKQFAVMSDKVSQDKPGRVLYSVRLFFS